MCNSKRLAVRGGGERGEHKTLSEKITKQKGLGGAQVVEGLHAWEVQGPESKPQLKIENNMLKSACQ